MSTSSKWSKTLHKTITVIHKTLILIAGDYPIFIKGSNWVPMDAFVTRATPEYARSLLESAVAAHQNMIRIW